MNSSNFEVEINRCEKFIAEKSFKKADESISNAIHINRDSPYAWYLKAKVSLGLLEYKKALRASKKAIDLNPKSEYIELKNNIENFIKLDVDELSFGDYPNYMDNMAILTMNKNIKLLSKRKLNNLVYKFILDDIACDVVKSSSEEDIFVNVKKLTENFINLEFIPNPNRDTSKNIAGQYGFKRAVVDSNLSKTLQIAAMIHELSHHLLFEIFTNSIMYVYKSQRTDTIEAFGWYGLTKNVYWLLMNEYCAHTVEHHYMNLNNYESFNDILRNNGDLDLKRVKKAVELGNNLANDIIYILDGFFTEEIVEEIKIQFLSDRVILTKKGCEVKTEVDLSEEEKFSMINSVLREILINIKINFSYRELNQFKEIFANVRG